jgi:prevent-host-death family protein
MEEPVSAADANRHFSRLLHDVRTGRSYVVTSHGNRVARLIPAEQHANTLVSACDSLLARLERQPVIDAGH